jgi:hypothetical protein
VSDRNPFESAWTMYASAKPSGLDFFGPLGFATQDREAKSVVLVHVAIVDDPTPEDYWAWMDLGASQPACIAADEQQMTAKFLLQQEGAPGPREEQAAGQGEIVRLRVTFLEEVALRRGRAGWRPNISSAM